MFSIFGVEMLKHWFTLFTDLSQSNSQFSIWTLKWVLLIICNHFCCSYWQIKNPFWTGSCPEWNDKGQIHSLKWQQKSVLFRSLPCCHLVCPFVIFLSNKALMLRSTDSLLAQCVWGRCWDAYKLHQPAAAVVAAGVWSPGTKQTTNTCTNYTYPHIIHTHTHIIPLSHPPTPTAMTLW